MSRGRILRALVGASFVLLPAGVVAMLPAPQELRALLSLGVVVVSSLGAWGGTSSVAVRALAGWTVALVVLSFLGVGHDVGGMLIALAWAVAGGWPRPERARERSSPPWIALVVAAGLAVWMIASPPAAVIDGDGPAHLGGVLDAFDADAWTPPDVSVHADRSRTDPRFGVLHGLYAALVDWSGASASVVFALATVLWVPLGYLGFVAWMRAWGTSSAVAALLALLMVLGGAGGRGFALWRAAFPGDAAVLMASFAIADVAHWLRREHRSALPVGAVLLLAASVAIHPFAWWIVVVCSTLAIVFAMAMRRHRDQVFGLVRFAVATGVLGGLLLLPRWTGRAASAEGIHQVATDVLFLDGSWLMVDPLALVHWGGLGAFLLGPLLLLAPRTWWKRPAAPLAAGTVLAAWVLAVNPLFATPAWGAVAYLLIRTLRLVVTPWWWWTLGRDVFEGWRDAGRVARLRSVVLLVVVGGLAWIEIGAALGVIGAGPPRNAPGVDARIAAMDRALDEVGATDGVVADPRTSYALRARRGGVWPLVPAAHSNPEDVTLVARLAAFRHLQGAVVDSSTWHDALATLPGAWILVHERPRDFGAYDEFGWIPAAGAARRLARRLDALGAPAVATGEGWSLHARPADGTWTAEARIAGGFVLRPDDGAAARVEASRFEVVAAAFDVVEARPGDTVTVSLTLRAHDGPARTIHPHWEEIALRWRGPTAAVPDFARAFDKVYRKVVLERSARSASRFAFGRVPFEGTWAPRHWPNDQLVVDRFEMRIPWHAPPGSYAVELSVQEKPWRPRRDLRDVLRDDDRYTGPVVATIEVLPAAGR